MKTILIATGIYPPDIGGPSVYAELISRGLGPEYDTIVLAYSKTLPRMPKFFRKLTYAVRAWKLAGQSDAILALSILGVGVAAVYVAKWRNKPLIVRVAGDRAWEDAVVDGTTHLLLDDFQKTLKRTRKQKRQEWVCKNASAIIVPSKYLAGIVAGWGIPREKIKLVANSANLAVRPLSKEEARKRLGIQGNVIISVGRLVPWKGFRMLIKLMPKFLEINPFFRLVIIGDGPDKKLLATMVQNLNMQKKIFLVGKKSREEMLLYLQSAELMILNSGYEGFSHQILEAMTAGVPVVTSNVGGNREIIRQGENGFMVKYNDEFNIVEAVKTLWHSSELREKFISEGKKSTAQYTPERTIRETKAVLEFIVH